MRMLKKILISILLLGSPSLYAWDWTNTGSYTSTNYYYWWGTSKLSRNSYTSADVTCPSSYPRIISGSCGHRDGNLLAQEHIEVNNSGGTNGKKTTSWRCSVSNNGDSISGGSRQLKWGMICGK